MRQMKKIIYIIIFFLLFAFGFSFWYLKYSYTSDYKCFSVIDCHSANFNGYETDMSIEPTWQRVHIPFLYHNLKGGNPYHLNITVRSNSPDILFINSAYIQVENNKIMVYDNPKPIELSLSVSLRYSYYSSENAKKNIVYNTYYTFTNPLIIKVENGLICHVVIEVTNKNGEKFILKQSFKGKHIKEAICIMNEYSRA